MWITGPERNIIINPNDCRSSPSTYSEFKYVQVTGWCDSEIKQKKTKPDETQLCSGTLRGAKHPNGLTWMRSQMKRAKAHTSAVLSVQ